MYKFVDMFCVSLIFILKKSNNWKYCKACSDNVRSLRHYCFTIRHSKSN
jgi:hypothetical protein